MFGDAKYPSINDAEDHEDLVDVLTTQVRPTAQTTMEDVQVGCTAETDAGGIGREEGEEVDIGFDEAIEDKIDSLDRDPTTSNQQLVSDTHSVISILFPVATPV